MLGPSPPPPSSQEIVDKAPLLPKDIRWHFVGHLQRNKVRGLLGAVPNVEVVESVDTAKLADKLSAFVLEESAVGGKGLREGVMAQTWGCSGLAPSAWDNVCAWTAALAAPRQAAQDLRGPTPFPRMLAQVGSR